MLISSEKGELKFKTKRPSKTDSKVMLCIPGAFSSKEDTIDGVYVVEGSIHASERVNHELGGALSIVNGKPSIFTTERGKLFTKDWLTHFAQSKGSSFQQFVLVNDGVASVFRDKSKFQRRGLAIAKSGAAIIIEGDQATTLNEFADDLISLKFKTVIYLDMGGWSEGWLRQPVTGKIAVIGKMKSDTKRQTNWLVFEVPQVDP